MAGVDPIVGAGDAADPVAEADRVVAVDAAARVAGSHRDALTDPFTGTGVGAGTVAARVARQVGERAQVILAAGCHRGNSATRTQLRAITGVSTSHALTWTAVFMPKAPASPARGHAWSWFTGRFNFPGLVSAELAGGGQGHVLCLELPPTASGVRWRIAILSRRAPIHPMPQRSVCGRCGCVRPNAGLAGGIARAVAGHAGWHGAGGEADKRAPRIAQISWGRMEVEDLARGRTS